MTRRWTLRAARGMRSRKIFDDVDVILTLSAPGAAPKGLGSTGDARYNRLWTLMGVPCVNVPTLVAEGGLPVGVTGHRAIWRRCAGAGGGAVCGRGAGAEMKYRTSLLLP